MNFIYYLIRYLVKIQRYRWARKRFKLFLNVMNPKYGSTILDLGGASGDFFYFFKNKISNLNLKITIADIDSKILKVARKRGFNTLVLNKEDLNNIPTNSFDIVFCNSVIEHVTIPEEEIWHCYDNDYFTRVAFNNQKNFAYNIKRIGKGYFVQTPHKIFIIESHTWLPFVAYLSRKHIIKILKWAKKHWLKATSPDWYLLNERQMKVLFNDADSIIIKKILFLKKEIIAFKRCV